MSIYKKVTPITLRAKYDAKLVNERRRQAQAWIKRIKEQKQSLKMSKDHTNG